MMLGARTAAWAKSGAPLPFSRKLAYLESHGTEVIDTGIIAASSDLMPITISVMPLTSGGSYREGFFGCGEQAYFSMKLCRHNGKYTFWNYMSFVSSSVPIKEGVKQDIVITADRFVVGDVVTEFALQGFRLPKTVALFGFRDTDSGEYYGMSKCRIYNFEIASHIYKPVMSLDDEPCLYDETSGELLRNVGGGAFDYGELS